MKKAAIIALFLAILIFNASHAYAEPLTPPDSQTIQTQQPQSESQSWFQKIGDELSSLLGTVNGLFKDGLNNLLELTIGRMLESAFASVAGGMNKWVFLTPRLVNYGWVRKLFWLTYAISIMMILAGAGISAITMLTGRRGQKGEFTPGRLFGGLFAGLLLCSLSLLIADGIISVKNYTANALASGTLYEMYHEAAKTNPELISREANARLKQGEKITQENIGFDSFDGIMLAKMAFSNPVPRGEFYKVFTTKSAGGLLIMIWAMLVMSLTALLGLLSYGIIGCIGGAAPLWFGSSAFTGNTDPVWGWCNLFSRSVLISVIFDLAWLVSVYVEKNPNEFMDSNRIISCVVFTVALALAVWLWGRWVVKAVLDPANLAGAEVRQKWGDFTEKTGKDIERLGRMYGNEELEHMGGRMQAAGREHRSIAVEKREGRFDPARGSEKDRLRKARIDYDKAVLNRECADGEMRDKVPYWTDGRYFYYKDAHTRREVRHLRPPENGRFISRV